ncbi:MAG: hypothetical protein IKM66_04370 [Clostridia bacterium]|nr:hypothetical protein [Clostridia bacterium]
MNKLLEYIENSCKNLADNQSSYRYKKMILDKMTERADEISRAGLRDEKVLTELIADEFCDLEAGYAEHEKKKRRKKLLKIGLPVGSLVFLTLILISFFVVSSTTGAWNKTWLVIVGGVFALVIFWFSLAIAKLCTMRRVFHPIARVLIAGCALLFAVFMFLFFLMMMPELLVWPILPAGVIIALLADLIFAFATKQKLRTISLFVYMPTISTMLYIILSAYKIVTWTAGWPIILLGLVADVAYIIYIIISNMKYFTYKQEVEE